MRADAAARRELCAVQAKHDATAKMVAELLATEGRATRNALAEQTRLVETKTVLGEQRSASLRAVGPSSPLATLARGTEVCAAADGGDGTGARGASTSMWAVAQAAYAQSALRHRFAMPAPPPAITASAPTTPPPSSPAVPERRIPRRTTK